MKERPILFSGPMVRAILAATKTKTQTRRVVTPAPPRVEDVHAKAGTGYRWFTDERAPGTFRVAGPVWAVRDLGYKPDGLKCPFGVPGDRLWVRETFWMDREQWVIYDATPRTCKDHNRDVWSLPDGEPTPTFKKYRDLGYVKKSPIFMPRWASRLTLNVTSVRVERLQDITENDALAEGITKVVPSDDAARVIGPAPIYARPGSNDFAEGWSAVSAFARLWREIHGPESWKANPWVWAIGFARVSAREDAVDAPSVAEGPL